MIYRNPGHWEWQWCSAWAGRSSHSRAVVGCGEKLTQAYHLLLALSAPSHPHWCHQSFCREMKETWDIKWKSSFRVMDCKCNITFKVAKFVTRCFYFLTSKSSVPSVRSKDDQTCGSRKVMEWSSRHSLPFARMHTCSIMELLSNSYDFHHVYSWMHVSQRRERILWTFNGTIVALFIMGYFYETPQSPVLPLYWCLWTRWTCSFVIMTIHQGCWKAWETGSFLKICISSQLTNGMNTMTSIQCCSVVQH